MSFENKVEYLEECLKRNPKSILFARLADYYLKQERIDDALRLCTQGVETNPDYITGIFILGKVYMMKGDLEKAEVEFRKVISHDRQYLSAHKYIADMMIKMGWESKAAVHYKDILQIDPLEKEVSQMLETFNLEEVVSEEIELELDDGLSFSAEEEIIDCGIKSEPETESLQEKKEEEKEVEEEEEKEVEKEVEKEEEKKVEEEEEEEEEEELDSLTIEKELDKVFEDEEEESAGAEGGVGAERESVEIDDEAFGFGEDFQLDEPIEKYQDELQEDLPKLEDITIEIDDEKGMQEESVQKSSLVQKEEENVNKKFAPLGEFTVDEIEKSQESDESESQTEETSDESAAQKKEEAKENAAIGGLSLAEEDTEEKSESEISVSDDEESDDTIKKLKNEESPENFAAVNTALHDTEEILSEIFPLDDTTDKKEQSDLILSEDNDDADGKAETPLISHQEDIAEISNEQNEKQAPLAVEEQQQEIAEKSEADDSEVEENKDNLVTPTLGEIYFAQGQFSKALDIYKTLQQKEPDNQEYQRKIMELNRKIKESK